MLQYFTKKPIYYSTYFFFIFNIEELTAYTTFLLRNFMASSLTYAKLFDHVPKTRKHCVYSISHIPAKKSERKKSTTIARNLGGGEEGEGEGEGEGEEGEEGEEGGNWTFGSTFFPNIPFPLPLLSPFFWMMKQKISI